MKLLYNCFQNCKPFQNRLNHYREIITRTRPNIYTFVRFAPDGKYCMTLFPVALLVFEILKKTFRGRVRRRRTRTSTIALSENALRVSLNERKTRKGASAANSITFTSFCWTVKQLTKPGSYLMWPLIWSKMTRTDCSARHKSVQLLQLRAQQSGTVRHLIRFTTTRHFALVSLHDHLRRSLCLCGSANRWELV